MIVRIVASGTQAFAATPTSAAPLPIEPVLRYAQPARIALPDFLAGSRAEADPAQAVSQIITANLKRSEQFVLIDQTAFIEKITNKAVPATVCERQREGDCSGGMVDCLDRC
jgi:Tol biopolymer transport system component